MDAEGKRRIHAALEKCGGDRIAAAVELGMARKRLENFIANNSDLRVRWSDQNRPGPKAVAVVQAIDDEQAEKEFEKALNAGGLGLESGEITSAAAFQKFGSRFHSQQISMVIGIANRQLLKLNTVLDRKMKELEDDAFANGTDIGLAEKKMTMDFVTKTMDQLRRLIADAHKNAQIRAMTAQKEKGGGAPRKPGFGRLVKNQVLVQAGGTAVLSGGPSE